MTTDKSERILREQEESLKERRSQNRHLFLRNVLNSTFMLLAIVAMVGILIFPSASTGAVVCYAIGLLAVLIKMVEVCFRMPTLTGAKKRNRKF